MGTLVAGQVLSSGALSAVVWMHAMLLMGAVLGTAVIPGLNARSQEGPNRKSSLFGGVRELCRIALFRRLIVVAALIYGSHAMQDTFAVIRWNAAGIDSAATSLLWSESVAAEVVVFFLIGPAIINRIGPSAAATLAAVAGSIRWVVMAQTSALAALALVQPLHGFTFALLHLACMRLIAVIVPTRLAATAQAGYAFGVGLATALLILISGVLYKQVGAQAFLLIALLCVVALPLTFRLRPGGPISGHNPADRVTRSI